jgi:hypothetical protein
MAHMCEFAYQPKNQILFIRIKDVPTQNIMSACSFNMQFMFVWAWWEDNVHDTYIFLKTIDNSNIKFLIPLEGSYVIEIECWHKYSNLHFYLLVLW